MADIDPDLYRKLIELPETHVGEILDGCLLSHRLPCPSWSIASSAMQHALMRQYTHDSTDGFGDWWILKRIEIHLGGNVLVPEIAGWLVESVPSMLELEHVDVVPKWVCEFAPPGRQSHLLTTKRRFYAQLGVQHSWIIHADDHRVEIYVLSKPDWKLVKTVSGTETTSLVPFDKCVIEFGLIWAK